MQNPRAHVRDGDGAYFVRGKNYYRHYSPRHRPGIEIF